jgi:hypothetical protein
LVFKKEKQGISNARRNQNRRRAHEIVGSRRKYRQVECLGVYVGIDVVEHSDGWKRVLIKRI